MLALGLLLVCAAAQAPNQAPDQASDQEPELEPEWKSVEREWAVRTWALDPAAHVTALRGALASPSWVRRVAALRALERAIAVGRLRADEPLAAELQPLVAHFDADSPALAQTLETCAVWPLPLELGGLAFESLAVHPLPAVRLGLVHLVARFDRGEPGAVLAGFVGDEDDRVARSAAQGWIARTSLADVFRAPPADDTVLRLAAEYVALERSHASDRALALLAGSGDAALFEALRLRVHGTGDLRVIAGGWVEDAGIGRRALLGRTARAARARGLPLAELLLERAPQAEGPLRFVLLEGAIDAAEPNALLARVRLGTSFDRELRLDLWELLLGRDVAWDPAEAGAWLDSGSGELRLRVVMTLAGSPVGGPGDAVGELLASALEDRSGDVRQVAFRALAGAPDPRPWFDALYRCWRDLPADPARGGGAADERRRYLDFLPRDPPPLPFRADLVELARSDPAARPAAVELLSGFPGMVPLAGRIEDWLDGELDRFLVLPPGDRREVELRCMALVRTLHRVGGDVVVPSLARTLERVRDHSDDIGKVIIMALGDTEEGRVLLAPWLEEEVPRRLRLEAALQLAPYGEARAVDVVTDRYGDRDWELRKRSIEALRGLRDDASFAFLQEVAGDGEQEYELRNLAVRGMARGSAPRYVRALVAVGEASRDPEVTRTVVLTLGIVGGDLARDHLRERLRRIERLDLEGRVDAQADYARDERDAVLVALGMANAGAFDPELATAWARLPSAASESDLERRFTGRKLPAVSFRFSGELELADVFASTGLLGRALEHAGEWWRFDARYLAALAQLAREPDTSDRLLRAAAVGLAGEGEAPDRAAIELDLHRELLAAAEARRDWVGFEGQARHLLHGWRTGYYSDRAFSLAGWGDYRPEQGSDPGARLESALHQARAWAELDARGAGYEERAHVYTDVARYALGFSASAHEAQERLEEELAKR